MDSPTVLCIFQLPAIILRRTSSRAATPGNTLPSKYSKEAPPPVEMWLIFSAKPSFSIAATESPPPTILTARLLATAFATASVPLQKASISNTPIGPFQTIILASFKAAA